MYLNSKFAIRNPQLKKPHCFHSIRFAFVPHATLIPFKQLGFAPHGAPRAHWKSQMSSQLTTGRTPGGSRYSHNDYQDCRYNETPNDNTAHCYASYRREERDTNQWSVHQD